MSSAQPAPAAETRLLPPLGLISAAATAQQIALMQVLGWTHWHHFAYMVVAIALLGFGLAGTVLTLAREKILRHGHRVLPWLLLSSALTMPAGVQLAQLPVVAVDLPLIFFEPARTWRLVALCVLLLPPFFGAGLVSGILLTANARAAGRFYAASLAGAGFGGLAGLGIVAWVSPPRVATATALLAWLAALWLWPMLTRVARAGVVLVFVGLAVFAWHPGNLRASQFKPIQRTLDLPAARIVAEKPSVHGWIQVVAAPALRPAPPVSLEFQGEIPAQPAVFVNGIGYGSLLSARDALAPDWLDSSTDAAPFAIAKPQRVLLLENGPGGITALAVQQGATHVTVVEPNRALVELLSNSEPPLAPEWRLPGVAIDVANGRAYLRRTPEQFDFIRFPSVGALGGSAGLAAASEQFLLTREAFVDAWQRLAPGGMLGVTAWMDFPERNALRLLATLAEAIEHAGGAPRVHLVALRGWATVTFIVRREAWSAPAVAALRAFCATRGFDPLLLPDLKPGEREAYHAWQNPDFFRLVDALVDGPRGGVYRDYVFNLRASTDDRPYFSQFMRWNQSAQLREVFGAQTMPFFELGSLVVGLTFGVLTALAIVCMVLPLGRRGWQAPGKPGVLLYFGGIGAGYMCVEIGLMLRAHAWLGNPVLAAAVVITALLIASGVGSRWSERLPADAPTQRRTAVTLAASVFVASILLAGLGPMARTWPASSQIAALVAIVAAVGFPLGVAFPLALRRLDATHPPHVPWAWAVNGCVSVATPAGALLLAMTAGFNALFAAAALAYAVAWVGTRFSGGTAMRSHSRPG